MLNLASFYEVIVQLSLPGNPGFFICAHLEKSCPMSWFHGKYFAISDMSKDDDEKYLN